MPGKTDKSHEDTIEGGAPGTIGHSFDKTVHGNENARYADEAEHCANDPEDDPHQWRLRQMLNQEWLVGELSRQRRVVFTRRAWRRIFRVYFTHQEA